MTHISQEENAPAIRFDGRDWLICVLLFLATIQCARADFFVNRTFVDWHAYAIGHAPLPYQGRAGLMPLFRWAASKPAIQHLSDRYASTVRVGTLGYQPITVEHFISLLLGLLSLGAMMVAAFWWSRHHRVQPWWLANVLVLLIVTVTTTMRSTTNYWYAYDLPHAALFGIGALCALEGFWVAAFACFLVDVPLRETSLFSIPVLAPIFLSQRRWRRPAWMIAAGGFGAAAIYWAVVRLQIARRFAGNSNETYSRIGQNLHEVLFPQHWPQLLSAGGYLLVFAWLERRRLPENQRMLLYGAAVCVPVTLWFGVWTETRVWMEWTLPLVILLTTQCVNWLAQRRFALPASLEPSNKTVGST